MKHATLKLFSAVFLCATLNACTDGASVTSAGDGETASFDFNGQWSGTMTPTGGSNTAPAGISLSISGSEVTIPDSDGDVTATGQASIEGPCWDGGPVTSSGASGTSVNFVVSDSTATLNFTGQFQGDRIEGNFSSRGGRCGDINGTWVIRR